jgi:hypothetical protein
MPYSLNDARGARGSRGVNAETANNLAAVLDFSRPDFAARQITVPVGPFGAACVPPGLPSAEWAPLLQVALDFGWFPSVYRKLMHI